MSINYFGCLNVCEAFFPLLKSNAKVINIVSRLGLLCRLPSPELKQRILKIEKIEQLTQIVNEYISACENGTNEKEGFSVTAYEMSKLALIYLTKLQQKLINMDKTRKNILIYSVCPGYCKTDLTKETGIITPDEGADTPVYLIVNSNIPNSKGGEFWSLRKIVDWEHEQLDYYMSPSGF